jgi:hypothetical protein
MKDSISRLEKYLEEVPDRIKSIPKDEMMSRPNCAKATVGKPATGKWSKKEIMGHLVDSAIYNIIRFTQVQYKPSPYVVEGYEQDKLVELNDYQNVPIENILMAWEQLNRQDIFILSKLTQEQLSIPIIRKGEEKTLGWLAEDYVNHMEHHLEQICDR